MFALVDGRAIIWLVILSTCYQAVEPARGNHGDQAETPNREIKQQIGKMPPGMQEGLFKKILNENNVGLSGEVDNDLRGELPGIIEALANGAIDTFLGGNPVIKQLLGPIISGGIKWLTSVFGEKKVYIPNMPPVITCPKNIIKTQDRGFKSAVVTWNDPTAFDAEDGQIFDFQQIGVKSGSRMNGEEQVKYTVWDKEGRKDFCIFHIKVEVIKCRPVEMKQYMESNCTSVNYYGDTCGFSCHKGFTLKGSQQITCEKTGFYNYDTPNCEVNKCSKPEIPNGAVGWDCSDGYNYRSGCTIKCASGFRNVRTHDRSPWNVATIECLADGTWTPAPRCVDVSAPVITNCPGTIQEYADRGRNSTLIKWSDITAEDGDGGAVNITQIKGPKSGSRFDEGPHEIEFLAVDEVGLTDRCIFYINIEVRSCPVPETPQEELDIDCRGDFTHGSSCSVSCLYGIKVKGSETITCELIEGRMQWQYPGGKSSCLVKTCPRLDRPPNAFFQCSPFPGRKRCSVQCDRGFIPARNEKALYSVCPFATGVWKNKDRAGCVRPRPSSSQKLNLLFYWKAGCSRSDVRNVTDTFKDVLSHNQFMRDCPQCRIVEVRSVCRKRSRYSMMAVRWAVEMDVKPKDDREFLQTKLNGAGALIKNWLRRNLSNLPLVGADSKPLQSKFRSYGIAVGCSQAFEADTARKTCAACGAGYEFDRVKCKLCPTGTFQNDSGDARCMPCPEGTATFGKVNTKASDCRAPCAPGTTSRTGHTPCRKCRVGYYQSNPKRRECESCPSGDITASTGSTSPQDCYAPTSQVMRLKVRTGERSANITWVRPSQANGNLEGFVLSYHKASENEASATVVDINDIRSEFVQVFNLEPGTEYTFTMWGVNSRGRGLARSVKKSTRDVTETTAAPTAPTTPSSITTTIDPSLCPPGTESYNGRRNSKGKCQKCGLGFFQDSYGQTDCKICGDGNTTWYKGSTSEADCVDETWTTPEPTPEPTTTTTTEPTTTVQEPCRAGTVSQTGFEPGCKKCSENKVPNKRRKRCKWCPRDGDKFICSPKSARTTTPMMEETSETTEAPQQETTEALAGSPDDSNRIGNVVVS